MDSGNGAGVSRRMPRWFVPALGYAVSIACLVWVYYGFNWKEQLPRLIATDWRFVTVAVVADVAIYVVQAWRWNLLLRPIQQLEFSRTVQAVYIGLFANEVLPLRSGEVIRCYLLARWNAIPFSVIVSSVVIERLVDGAWLALGFWMATFFVELPGYLVAAARVLVIGLAVLGVLFLIAVLHKKHAHAAVKNSRWSEVLRHVVDGSHDMGRSPTFLAAAVVSLFYLLLQVVPIYSLAFAYGINVTILETAVILVILRLGSIPPQAPGNMGAFQFFTILGLGLFGVPRGEATGFATLLFVVVTVPLWFGGFIALLATRMRLTDIHRHAHGHLRN
jgi:uncharacterized protein (TIRG00374 family)